MKFIGNPRISLRLSLGIALVLDHIVDHEPYWNLTLYLPFFSIDVNWKLKNNRPFI